MNLIDAQIADADSTKPRSRGDEPNVPFNGASDIAKTPLTRG